MTWALRTEVYLCSLIRWLYNNLIIVTMSVLVARAGGPRDVAGSTYFVPGSMGQPVTWAQGQVNYYTDQGDLSPILPNAAANSFIASAFSQWTAVSTAALTVTAAGQLSEDVNGTDIMVSGGMITAPADIAPSATTKPLGIVYDSDGTVTDALLGQGAGDASQCFWNAAFGGADNLGTSANFLHALVVVNGQCAQESSQLTDVEYRLVRVLGSVLGLGWSQLNLNVITGHPTPTAADFAGFPVMHDLDPASCVPITRCYTNPLQIAPDDMAALSRLYPLGGSTTTRIHGSVYFVDGTGNAAQPMQGVNVVARWIDPSSGLPSDQYSASSVSGFLFTGNAGNPITGFADALGTPFSQFGSNDQALEGFFDLGGMVIPNGGTTAQYQLTVEALDPIWSAGVGPYAPMQIAPSGTSQPIVVTLSAGGDFVQDLVMAGSAQALPPWAAPESWSAPAAILPAGDWEGSLSGYDDVPYFSITAQGNRTLSVAVTAFDETGAPSENKAEPVIGMWTMGDPQGTPPPALTTSPFNSVAAFAMTRLDTQVLSSNTFLIGISDLRGDGRPDYHYHAHVLYADSLTPARVGVNGGPVLVQGIGFEPSFTASIGSVNVPVLTVDAGQMLLAVPPFGDGMQTLTINDAASGSYSTMTSALAVGAAASDRLLPVQLSNPLTPIGTQAPNPVVVKVVAADGVTPVNGATIGWSVTAGSGLSVCNGGNACTISTDESGISSTLVTPGTVGGVTVVATLAPGVYSPAQSLVTTVVGSSSSPSLDLGITPRVLYVAQGATVSTPLTARVVNNGVPQSGKTVNFQMVSGSGSLSASSATTDSNGYAAVTLTLTNLTNGVQLTACVAPNNNPCQTVLVNAVTTLNLQEVAGNGQVVAGQGLAPVTVRVTDSSTPPNPVLGASVTFVSTMSRPPAGGQIVVPDGDPSPRNPAMPVVLSVSQTMVVSDVNGSASFVPSTGSFTAPLEIAITVSTGTSAALQYELEVLSQIPCLESGQCNVNSSDDSIYCTDDDAAIYPGGVTTDGPATLPLTCVNTAIASWGQPTTVKWTCPPGQLIPTDSPDGRGGSACDYSTIAATLAAMPENGPGVWYKIKSTNGTSLANEPFGAQNIYAENNLTMPPAVTGTRSAPVWITSDQYPNLAATGLGEGQRATMAWVGTPCDNSGCTNTASGQITTAYPQWSNPTAPGIYFPEIRNGGINVPTLSADATTTYLRMMGIEFTSASGVSIDNKLIVLPAGSDHVILDRVLIHCGDSKTLTHTNSPCSDGVSLNGRYEALINSTDADIWCGNGQSHSACPEGHGLGWGSSPTAANEGPYKVVNNFISAGGEEILTGGGATAITPYDAEIRRNNLYKPLYWDDYACYINNPWTPGSLPSQCVDPFGNPEHAWNRYEIAKISCSGGVITATSVLPTPYFVPAVVPSTKMSFVGVADANFNQSNLTLTSWSVTGGVATFTVTTAGACDGPSVGGTAKTNGIVVKNHIEFKNQNRFLLEGNTLINEWWGDSDQFGEAILFGPIGNQGDTVPGGVATMNGTIRYNFIQHANKGIGIGAEINGLVGVGGIGPLSVQNNIFDDLNGQKWAVTDDSRLAILTALGSLPYGRQSMTITNAAGSLSCVGNVVTATAYYNLHSPPLIAGQPIYVAGAGISGYNGGPFTLASASSNAGGAGYPVSTLTWIVSNCPTSSSSGGTITGAGPGSSPYNISLVHNTSIQNTVDGSDDSRMAFAAVSDDSNITPLTGTCSLDLTGTICTYVSGTNFVAGCANYNSGWVGAPFIIDGVGAFPVASSPCPTATTLTLTTPATSVAGTTVGWTGPCVSGCTQNQGNPWSGIVMTANISPSAINATGPTPGGGALGNANAFFVSSSCGTGSGGVANVCSCISDNVWPTHQSSLAPANTPFPNANPPGNHCTNTAGGNNNDTPDHTLATVGFANYKGGNGGGDYTLCTGVGTPDPLCPAASPFWTGKGWATFDGLPPGADVALVNAYTSGPPPGPSSGPAPHRFLPVGPARPVVIRLRGTGPVVGPGRLATAPASPRRRDALTKR